MDKPTLSIKHAENLRDEAIDRAFRELEMAIMCTPSGKARNHLCDASIHIAAARDEIKKEQHV